MKREWTGKLKIQSLKRLSFHWKSWIRPRFFDQRHSLGRAINTRTSRNLPLTHARASRVFRAVSRCSQAFPAIHRGAPLTVSGRHKTLSVFTFHTLYLSFIFHLFHIFPCISISIARLARGTTNMYVFIFSKYNNKVRKAYKSRRDRRSRFTTTLVSTSTSLTLRSRHSTSSVSQTEMSLRASLRDGFLDIAAASEKKGGKKNHHTCALAAWRHLYRHRLFLRPSDRQLPPPHRSSYHPPGSQPPPSRELTTVRAIGHFLVPARQVSVSDQMREARVSHSCKNDDLSSMLQILRKI